MDYRLSIYGRCLHAFGKCHVRACTRISGHSVWTLKFQFPTTHTAGRHDRLWGFWHGLQIPWTLTPCEPPPLCLGLSLHTRLPNKSFLFAKWSSFFSIVTQAVNNVAFVWCHVILGSFWLSHFIQCTKLWKRSMLPFLSHLCFFFMEFPMASYNSSHLVMALSSPLHRSDSPAALLKCEGKGLKHKSITAAQCH